MDRINTVGRRKSAIARVILTKGKGKITVNSKEYKNFFTVTHLQNMVEDPFKTLESEDQFDAVVNVRGGGIKGQAEAVRLGIARALCEVNPEFRPPLKARGMLTRDPRVVERKKPGYRKARKKAQFSKR